MSKAPEDDEELPPRLGCWFLVIPVVVVALMVSGYLLVVGLGIVGRAPDGPTVRMDFTGCDAAQPAVLRRVEAMGLADPVVQDTPEGFALTLRLPSDPVAAAEIPVTLAKTAQFAVYAGSEATGAPLLGPEGVQSTTLRLDFTVNARAAIQLTPEATAILEARAEAHKGEVISVWLDDARLGERVLEPESAWDRLDFEAATGQREGSIRRAAEWALLVGQGPLPCPLQVVVTAAE